MLIGVLPEDRRKGDRRRQPESSFGLDGATGAGGTDLADEKSAAG
jgi:hypothetical protein